MKKKIVILFLMIFILTPAMIRSQKPPNPIIEKNSEAEVIVIGEIYDQGAALLIQNPPENPGRPPLARFMVLKVVFVLKGDEKIKPDNFIHILCQSDPEKIHDSNNCDIAGISPVQAERGILMIIHADALPRNPGFYSSKTAFPLSLLSLLF
jgi:hypothetical protein